MPAPQASPFVSADPQPELQCSRHLIKQGLPLRHAGKQGEGGTGERLALPHPKGRRSGRGAWLGSGAAGLGAASAHPAPRWPPWSQRGSGRDTGKGLKQEPSFCCLSYSLLLEYRPLSWRFKEINDRVLVSSAVPFLDYNNWPLPLAVITVPTSSGIYPKHIS